MVSAAQVARAHQARVSGRIEKATQRALRAWRGVSAVDLDASWAEVAPTILRQVEAVQRANAVEATAYTSAATTRSSAVRVVPEAFVGIDGSGRSAESLLHGSVTTTKQHIGRGAPIPNAMLAGGAYLAAMMKTALADIARSSDLTGAAGRRYTRYVRVVQSGACSRCAILAGSDRFSKHFLRHPACQCLSFPITNEIPSGFFSTPGEYFDSLSGPEQERVFTKAGAEAIRAGADPVRVVSARRGATGIGYSGAIGTRNGVPTWNRMQRTTIGFRPDGSPIQVFTTSEGTTVRGMFGRAQQELGVATRRVGDARYSSTNRIRIMPESIIDLTDDPSMRQLLLRDAGYLDYPIRNYSDNNWIAEHRVLRAQDRVAADTFYRSLGIQLG